MTLECLIALYRPDSVVMGLRGQRGMMQTWECIFRPVRCGQRIKSSPLEFPRVNHRCSP
ncbi:uncharacterized protein EDB91DRAFT_1170629 [Suillus paluster]|uniref:uncharacterized protein n=1 Tax=Suillus paluster TaxID=48578 RepID=UPI001B862FA1|nr:uncharacterized protein EDB91DRAFT_1170629 [Suillus paluster]KAG1724655.1 hypothetical protein EDB91DRAFT_1170629 [Suillus paluster]